MEDVDTQSSVQLRGKPLIFSEDRVSESVQDYPHYIIYCVKTAKTQNKNGALLGERYDSCLPVCALRTGGNTLILDFVQPHVVCLYV